APTVEALEDPGAGGRVEGSGRAGGDRQGQDAAGEAFRQPLPGALPGGTAVEAAPEAFAPQVDAGVLGGVHGDDLDRGLDEAPARQVPSGAAVGALERALEAGGGMDPLR